MRHGRIALLALTTAVGAWGQESNDRSRSVNGAPPVLTAADLGDQAALTAADVLAIEPYAGADCDNGQHQAQRCRVYHSLEECAPHGLGPNLYGFFGRENAAPPDFDYSVPMREVSFRWTLIALDAWLSAPARCLPGNRMSFTGIPNADDRTDLIAYLPEATSGP